MSYVTPTVALTFSPASPKAGEPFKVIATVTSTGDVGIKLRRGAVVRLSGPDAKFGEFELVGIPKFAGVNKPSTADYLANAGSSATSEVRFPGIAFTAGTLAVDCEVVLTRDDTAAEVRILAGSTNVTIASAGY